MIAIKATVTLCNQGINLDAANQWISWDHLVRNPHVRGKDMETVRLGFYKEDPLAKTINDWRNLAYDLSAKENSEQKVWVVIHSDAYETKAVYVFDKEKDAKEMEYSIVCLSAGNYVELFERVVTV